MLPCRLWQAFSFITLDHFMTVRGYTFYLACLYLLSICLFVYLGLVVWMARVMQINQLERFW
jgi:hypothetical protein